MNDALDIALHSARFWRDRGADILIAALLVEFLIEAMWSEQSKRKFLALSRKQAMIAAAFVVFFGVAIERIWGTLADDKSDEIRTNLQKKTIALSPRWWLLDGESGQRIAAALSVFHGQKIELSMGLFSGTEVALVLEPTSCLGAIANILNNAGWVDPNGKSDLPYIGWRQRGATFIGLWIEVAPDAPDKTRAAAKLMYDQLKKAHLEVSGLHPIQSVPWPPGDDSSTIVVTIGTRG